MRGGAKEIIIPILGREHSSLSHGKPRVARHDHTITAAGSQSSLGASQYMCCILSEAFSHY